LSHAWSDVAESLTRTADLLVDGGFLLHYLRLVARSAHQNSSAQGVTAANYTSIADAASAMEAPLQTALSTEGGRFTSHVAAMFDLSQLLSDMWTNAGYDPPVSELAVLRAAWGRVAIVAKELREALRGSGSLRHDLLLAHVEAFDDTPLHVRFPPPTACLRDGQSLAMWHMKHGSALLLSHVEGQVVFRCDVHHGHMERAEKDMLRLQGSDFGNFLETILR